MPLFDLYYILMFLKLVGITRAKIDSSGKNLDIDNLTSNPHQIKSGLPDFRNMI